jgi:tetratricopeptide (TPR) repeat protein
MDTLITVASLQQQLATVAEKKRKLHVALHHLNMSDIEKRVETVQLQQECDFLPSQALSGHHHTSTQATKPPSAIPPQFVTLHIPIHGTYQASATSDTLKPEAEDFCSPRANVAAEIMVNDLAAATTATAPKINAETLSPASQRKHNFTPSSAKPISCARNPSAKLLPPPPRRKRSLPTSSAKLTECTGKPSVEDSTTKHKENKRQQHITTPTNGITNGITDSEPKGPSAKKSRVSLPLPLQIESLRIEADILHIDGNLVQAGHKYILAINLSGPWTERSMHASLHFNYAICQIKQERFDEAIIHATEAVKLEPTFAEAHYALGYASGKLGKDLHLSMRSFKQVLKLKRNIRIKLPNGIMFGQKEHPLLSETDFLIVYRRKSCAHMKVPPHWTTRESRSQPGKIFFENLQTRATTWILPVEKKKNYRSLDDILAASTGNGARKFKKKGAAAILTQNKN